MLAAHGAMLASQAPAAPVQFVAGSAVPFATAGSMQLVVPAGVTSDDLLVALVMHRANASPPAGWTFHGEAVCANAEVPRQSLSVYSRTGLAAGAGITFAFAAANRVAGQILTFRRPGDLGVKRLAQSAENAGNASTHQTPQVNVRAGEAAFAAATTIRTAAGASTMAVSSGWTLTSPASSNDTANQIRLGVGIRAGMSAAFESAATFTSNVPAIDTGWCGISAVVG